MQQDGSRLKIAVGIATAGRRETLSNALRQLALQHRAPDVLMVCPAKPADFDEQIIPVLPFPTRVVHGPLGLTSQRNAILALCDDYDVIVFFDDDFYADSRYLSAVEALLLQRPEVVGVTGYPVADGNLTPGIPHRDALELLARAPLPANNGVSPVYNMYGCNMTFRLDPIRQQRLKFDENLPLYGWLEDVDFSRQLASSGELVKLDALIGVHLAEKRGRTSGVRFGYSQVANPVYLMRKGTMSPQRALRQMSRNLARNVQRALHQPEPWIDRRGRVRGNLLALSDLLLRRMRPEKIVELA